VGCEAITTLQARWIFLVFGLPGPVDLPGRLAHTSAVGDWWLEIVYFGAQGNVEKRRSAILNRQSRCVLYGNLGGTHSCRLKIRLSRVSIADRNSSIQLMSKPAMLSAVLRTSPSAAGTVAISASHRAAVAAGMAVVDTVIPVPSANPTR